jgi:hypothetical protein
MGVAAQGFLSAEKVPPPPALSGRRVERVITRRAEERDGKLWAGCDGLGNDAL